MRIQSAFFALLLPFLTLGQSPCDQLNAAFTWNSTPNGVQFSNATTGTGGSTTWLWSFGDNTGHIVAEPFHAYAHPGSYQVCLTVISLYELPNGEFLSCQDTACAFIQIGGDPCADLHACFVPNDLGAGNFFFDNCTTNPLGTQYSWDFGDGFQNTTTHAGHHYDQPGTYTVCLFAYWQNCVDTTCTAITVIGANPCDSLNANFTWGGGIDGVDFGNEVVDNMWTYSWHFGDGTAAYGPDPVHVYSEPGTYEACLTVWTWNPATQDTCFMDHCEMITVLEEGPCGALQATMDWGVTGTNTIQFNGTTNFLPDGFVWSFGDGQDGYNPSETHSYAAAGEYFVCFSAYRWNPQTQDTCWTEDCRMIYVGVNDPCDDFQACIVPTDLGNGDWSFESCAVEPPGTQFFLYFGDGGSSTEINVAHHFDHPGTYDVCLYAYWGNCADTTCTTITVVDENPCASLNANFNWGGSAVGVDFSNAVVDNTWTYFWQFGDGTTDFGPNPFHAYPAPGTYQACLTVWTWDPATQDTCFADHCEMITVQNSTPCPGLQADFNQNTTPNGTLFSNSTVGTGFQTSWFWTFGDGQTSTDAEPYHLYTQDGTYTACLTVVSTFAMGNDELINCSDSICHTIQIGGTDPCNDLHPCFVPTGLTNGSWFFDNCATGPVGFQIYWDLGDGTTSTETNVEHHFDQPGTYTVCQIANWESCSDTLCTVVTIPGDSSCTGFTVSFQPSYQNNAVSFTGTSSVAGTFMNWTFGDGAIGYGTTVTHLYEPPGPFEVCLEAWYWNDAAQDSCFATSCELVDPFMNVGMTDLSADGFRVLPIPAHDKLTITGPTSLGGSIVRILGMDGRLEIQGRSTGSPYQIDISGLAPAVHLLQIEQAGQRFNYRIVVE